MSQKEKLIKRLLSMPVDFTFEELEKLLGFFGYTISNKGKTSGSRIKFDCEGKSPIFLHKPHPQNVFKKYQLKQVIEILKEKGLI